MEKRIELERRGRAVDEIKELNLDNCRATQVSGLTSEYVQLESLSLINVGLTTLKGFPSLPNLKKLELSDNRISNGLNQLQGCPKLTCINLSGNKIKDMETLEPLKSLVELRTLDLFNCEVTNIEDYREKVFTTLQSLKYLDGFDRNNEEADDEDVGESDDEDYDDENDYGEPGDDDDDDDDDGEEGGDDDDDVDGSDLLLDTGTADDDDDDDLDDDDDDDDLDDDDDFDDDGEGEFNESGDLNGDGHPENDDDDDVDDNDEDDQENGDVPHGVKRKHDDDDDDDEDDE